MELERDAPAAKRPEDVRRLAFPEQGLAGLEAIRPGTAGKLVRKRVVEAPKTRASRTTCVKRLASLVLPRIAAASSVMSMPTGHQAMQRPQPTQPLVPNWSCQVASLCVIHCR